MRAENVAIEALGQRPEPTPLAFIEETRDRTGSGTTPFHRTERASSELVSWHVITNWICSCLTIILLMIRIGLRSADTSGRDDKVA